MERTGDREYFQLLHFLHGLRLFRGLEWLPVRKSETPDFEVEDESGHLIGIEVAEAPLSQSWADTQDDAECVFRALRPIIRRHSVELTFLFPIDWSALAAQVLELETWSEGELAARSRPGAAEFSLAHRGLDCEIKVKRSAGGAIWHFDSDGQTQADLDRRCSDLAVGIRLAVEKKLWRVRRNGFRKPRKAPALRPCHLVLYPNSDFGRGVEEACQIFRQGPAIPVNSHFDSVWVANETFMDQII